MDDTPESLDKLTYDAELFVDRDWEIERILNKARDIATRKPEMQRVVRFLEQRGTGKTWMLRRLKDLAPTTGMAPYYCRLDDKLDVQSFRQAVANLPRPLLLLLDIDGAPEAALDEIGNRVLGRLVRDKRVLIVLAERGGGHFWAIPDFNDAIEEMVLAPFGRTHIKEMVRRQVPDSTANLDDIERLGHGYPWSTYLLASPAPDGRQPVARCIDALLFKINGGLRDRFSALAVLHTFNDDRVEPLLRAYSPAFDRLEWPHRACHELCLDLVKSTLARWDDGLRGYVIDEPLRLVLEEDLRAHQHKLWVNLHEAAYLMYAGLLQADPSTAPLWAAELDYHGQQLDKAGRPRPQPVSPEPPGEGEENDR